MMRRFFGQRPSVAILLGLTLLVPLGCGGSGGGDAAKGEPSATGVPLSGPARTVQVFLEGMRRGDDEAVRAMFTEKARNELARAGQSITPRASDSTRYEVGEVRISPEDKNVAYVTSLRIRVDAETNQSQSEEFIWALRNVPEGWRIAGMAKTIKPGEPRQMVDFENLAGTPSPDANQRGGATTSSASSQTANSTVLSPSATSPR